MDSATLYGANKQDIHETSYKFVRGPYWASTWITKLTSSLLSARHPDQRGPLTIAKH